ncbi:LOW QUALITY PROTEIN: DNA-binding protein SMUBP-2-like [Gigantopelta aegis]|uniref:LOW QUALITY PROTEIN: DNA-binding protein SMUBP-2-like n=1 Tax=Gigantopelta aegis TaxID=1735272 RepID=UPI001B88CD75|nr:LOW QUALITY PROTEIN: DNA-binding protein SMUBP-2-like [Gigantopelta aegis]
MDLETFVDKTLHLLETERQSEVEEARILTEKLPPKELQRRGVCLLKLRLAERRSGLYGRTLVTLQPFWPGPDLPSHSFTPGDIIGLSLSQGENQPDLASGIVSKVTQASVTVAFEESDDVFSWDDDTQYKIMKLANNVTYRRLKKALKNLNKYSSRPSQGLISVLFGLSEFSPPTKETEINFMNEKLDESQKEAVRFALRQREVAVIHGPPGTGKTTTVVEVILQAVGRGLKVLACAPSNVAVDNLVEKVSSSLQKVVRIGHPARLLPHIQKYALDAIVARSDETKLVQDVRKDLDEAFNKVKRSRNKGEKHGLRDDIRHLRRELVQREKAAITEILKKADVILVTLTSASSEGPLKFLDEDHFDLAIIDECSQALEAACWIGLMRAPRCVLAGDHHQLPPTILSHEAARNGLDVTLMERILKTSSADVVRMLTTQYRMNQAIMQWSSDQLYDGKLVAHESVRNHLLKDLPGVEECEETSCPLLLIDTTGCDLYELDLPEEISKGNEGEADIVAAHVEKLITSGLNPCDIALITPYNLQVDILRLRLSTKYPALEIKSVDGFQGREKEAVVISFVRSNLKGVVGFLAENRRINVAITRARRHVAIVCDTETVGHNHFLKTLIEYFTEHGEVWSAQEYVQSGQVVHVGTRPERLDNILSEKSQTKTKWKKTAKDSKTRTDTESQTRQNQFIIKLNLRGMSVTRKSDVEKEEEFTKILTDFTSDEKLDTKEFPSSLNSHDRLLLHQLSEKLGLCHISKGEDKDRHIMVSKPGRGKMEAASSSSQVSSAQSQMEKPRNSERQPETGEKNSGQKSVEPGQVDESVTEKTSYKVDSETINDANIVLSGEPQQTVPSDKISCKFCGKDVISANIHLHELHCSRQNNKPAVSGGALPKRKEVKSANKSSRGRNDILTKKTAAALANVDADDFDGMISAVQNMDSKCHFKKCKEMTLTFSQTCQFCRQRFCYAHAMPEVHGCGDEAKFAARQTVIKEGILFRGNTAQNKKIDPDKRAHLQRKLDKKLADMGGKRTGKNKKQ